MTIVAPPSAVGFRAPANESISTLAGSAGEARSSEMTPIPSRFGSGGGSGRLIYGRARGVSTVVRRRHDGTEVARVAALEPCARGGVVGLSARWADPLPPAGSKKEGHMRRVEPDSGPIGQVEAQWLRAAQ